MLVKTDPIQKIILIIIIIIIIIIIKSQGKIAAAFYVFVGIMGFPKQNTTFLLLFFFLSSSDLLSLEIHSCPGLRCSTPSGAGPRW